MLTYRCTTWRFPVIAHAEPIMWNLLTGWFLLNVARDILIYIAVVCHKKHNAPGGSAPPHPKTSLRCTKGESCLPGRIYGGSIYLLVLSTGSICCVSTELCVFTWHMCG